jgi:murein DD-endopeptidase MepM/ murein hydrolase activator NlpD
MSDSDGFLWLTLGTASLALIVAALRRTDLLRSPLSARGVPRITPHGGFGASRRGPPAHLHQGLDLVSRAHSKVLAVGDGKVVATDPGLGKIVRKLSLDIPGRWSTDADFVNFVVYADLGTPLVEPGDRVRKGDPIALVAPGGFVHFAVKQRRHGQEVFIDPALAGFTYRSREEPT